MSPLNSNKFVLNKYLYAFLSLKLKYLKLSNLRLANIKIARKIKKMTKIIISYHLKKKCDGGMRD